MASLVDFRPNSSSTPPTSPSYSPGTHAPPIKTTTNTLPPAPQSQPQMAASIPTTPGLDIPGAFPREKNTTSPETSAPGPAPRQSVPETRAARSLLPRGHSCANTATLPSTEKEGVKPGEHYDGVGPLPGSISETSVAKLPDERLQQSAGEKRDQSVRQPAAEAGAASLPSQETQGALPGEHHGGAGPLPGSGDETAVAKLPDERASATSEKRSGAAAAGTRSQEPVSVSDTGASSENKAPAPSYALGGAGDAAAQVQGIDQEPVSAPPKAQEREDQGADEKKTPADSKFKEEVATEEKKSRPEGKDEPKPESRRAPAEEPTSSKQPEGTRAAVPPAPVASGARMGRKGRSSSDSDASDHKKASVMNKVKGEMMALLGKASRNKERVEAGEKLKHGSD